MTKRFPFPEQSVDYFHTEHMIEHVPLSSAQFVMNECYRTLKPGGKIRIATPDIMKLARLLLDPDELFGALEVGDAGAERGVAHAGIVWGDRVPRRRRRRGTLMQSRKPRG